MSYIEFVRLTWPQAAEVGARSIGLIPLGAVEQHGPHLPLAMDSIIAQRLAQAVAERIDEPVLVAPPPTAGLSHRHLGFPGTVTFSPAVLERVLRAYIRTFEGIGVRRVALFSAHGGNFDFIGRFAAAYSSSARRRNERAEVAAYDDLDRFLAAMIDGANSAGLMPAAMDLHAGALETSLALFSSGPTG